MGCGAWPACDYRQPLASGSDAAARAAPKRLGTDPASGLAVTLRRGPHGHYIQLGGAGEAKPRRMSMPGGLDPDGIGLEAALALLELPREVGAHPESGQPILAGIGRYGPWVRHGATYAAIPEGEDVLIQRHAGNGQGLLDRRPVHILCRRILPRRIERRLQRLLRHVAGLGPAQP